MAVMIASKPVESIPLIVSLNGTITVGETRVTLDTVVDAFQAGATPEEIAYQYPSLQLADIYAVVGYYLSHPDKVAAYLLGRQDLAERVRRENELNAPPHGVRARLLARQSHSAPQGD